MRALRLLMLLMTMVASSILPDRVLLAQPAASRLERIKAAGRMRVCIWPDYYSITYRNPKTQILAGIDIDLAGELGKELGVSVEFVDSSFAR